MNVALAGGSGFIGTALATALRAGGHQVVAIGRDGHVPRLDGVGPVDALINLAGAGIGDRRWSAARRKEILDSRLTMTSTLAAWAGDHAPVMLSASAVGYYGDRGDELLDERSAPGTGFLAEVCQRWEAATAPAAQAGVRVCHLRTGVVLGARGGALAKQLPLFRLGLGGRLGSGRQWLSWIALADHVAATIALLDADVEGPVNLVSPEPVRNETFTTVLGEVLHRPTVARVPASVLRLALGELADELLLGGQRVSPAVLSATGFRWTTPTLRGALTAAIAERR